MESRDAWGLWGERRGGDAWGWWACEREDAQADGAEITNPAR